MGKIGAPDVIDRLLVQKYGNMQTNNFTDLKSMIDAEQIQRDRNKMAQMDRALFMNLQSLNQSCYHINAMSAQYRKAHVIEGVS